jgi:hypothetical protein
MPLLLWQLRTYVLAISKGPEINDPSVSYLVCRDRGVHCAGGTFLMKSLAILPLKKTCRDNRGGYDP